MAKTYTPKFGLTQWGLGTDTLLRTDINTSFLNIESRAVKETRGLLSSRPAFGQPGSYFVDTATGFRYRDTGTSWVLEPVSSGVIVGVIPVANIPNLDAGKITGVFALARIPSLPASQTTSGTFDLARIPVLDTSRVPNLDAGKTTSGVFADARIPNLNASKTTAGVFDVARIPNLDQSKIGGTWSKSVNTTSTVAGRDLFASESLNTKHLIASGNTNLRNTAVQGTLDVTGFASFNDALFAEVYAAGGVETSTGRSVLSRGGLCAAGRQTTTSSSNVRYTSGGWLLEITSLRDTKIDIQDLNVPALDSVMSLRPRTWIDKASYENLADALTKEESGEEVDWDSFEVYSDRVPGFVAEEVEEVPGLETFLSKNEAGELTGIQYDRITALLTSALQEMKAIVDAQAERIAALESLTSGH